MTYMPLETSACTRQPDHKPPPSKRRKAQRKSNRPQAHGRKSQRRNDQHAPDPQHIHSVPGGASGEFEVSDGGPYSQGLANMAERHWQATWRADRVLTGKAQMLPCPREEGLRREATRRRREADDRQRNQHLEPSSTRTGSMASLIQQEISTAAGQGAGSISAHAALPQD